MENDVVDSKEIIDSGNERSQSIDMEQLFKDIENDGDLFKNLFDDEESNDEENEDSGFSRSGHSSGAGNAIFDINSLLGTNVKTPQSIPTRSGNTHNSKLSEHFIFKITQPLSPFL